MAGSNNHAVVSHWFAERMASGDLGRDPAAHAQAVAARDDLVKRLDAAKAPPASLVGEWFLEAIATGAIARNTVAYNQASAAKGELIARLADPAGPANVVRQAKPKARLAEVSKAKPVAAPVPVPPKPAPETPA